MQCLLECQEKIFYRNLSEDSKIYIKMQRTLKFQDIFKKNKVEGVTLPNFKTKYKRQRIKISLYGIKTNTFIEENIELIKLNTCSLLIYNKVKLKFNEEKDGFVNKWF